MSNPALASPIPVHYEARFEHPEEDEATTTASQPNTLGGISEKTLTDVGQPLRSVHAKDHGLLRGELRVLTGLAPALAQGLFNTPMAFPIVMRLSTIPGDLPDDSVSTPRGMAIKVVGAEGPRLPGSESDVTQDFLLVNGPSFAMSNAKSFLTTLKKLGGHPETHILGETFYSPSPMLHGPYMAKLSVVPISPGMLLLKKAALDLQGKPDGLRDAVVDFFGSHSAEWELRVQLCTDVNAMPIQDASAVWSEKLSPHLPVARITVPPQPAWSEARAAVINSSYSFSPWHGLAAHRPLGSGMRARKAAYEISERLRASQSGRHLQEPRSLDDLPD